jgi:hypothetical protein
MSKHHKWTEADKGQLRRLWSGPMLREEIALHMSRSLSAILRMKKKLNLPHRNKGKKTHPIHAMAPGESRVVNLTIRQRKLWMDVAREHKVPIETKRIMLKGEVCYRITRRAA